MGFVKIMTDVRQVFAGDLQMARAVHVAHGQHDV